MARSLIARLGRPLLAAAVLLAAAGAGTSALFAQAPAPPAADRELRDRVERQYEVLPLRDGVLLRSRDARPRRSIEIAGGRIAIDGVEVTGAELRRQLGPDADVVLQLSYLDARAQHELFGLQSQAESPAAGRAGGDVTSVEREQRRTEQVERQVERRNRRGGGIVRFGGDASVGPDETVTSDVVVFGGTARVEGRVEGDVVSIGGGVELGPRAHVTGDVVTVGGTLRRDPGATIDGEISEVGIGQAIMDRVRRGREEAVSPVARARRFLSFSGFAATAVRTVALMLLACVLLLAAPRLVERIGDRAVAEPVKAGLVGFLLELVFVPALLASIILLIVTIVGIPLLALIPVALLAAVIVLLVGFTAVARRVGERIAERIGWQTPSPYLLAVAGIVIILAPLLLARLLGVAFGGLAVLTVPLTIVGVCAEYLAWTIGLGAAALVRFGPRPAA